MPVAVIINLIVTLGPSAINLISALISKWNTNGVVTPEEWTPLAAELKLSAADHMAAQLKAANVDPSSPLAQALAAMSK